MAEIVLGMASSHAPQLEMVPERWREYGDRSRTQNEHWYNGKIYDYGELAELRASENIAKELGEATFSKRFDACQTAITHIGETYNKVNPDVCVILGDDQHELFQDDHMPGFAIYHGESVEDMPRGAGPGPYSFTDATIGNRPSGSTMQPTDADLGLHLIESMVKAEFDVARSNKLPISRSEGHIGHAFYFFYRRLMDNKATPSVPVMVNTYYPPNAPTAARCYKFGQEIGRAIQSWDTNKRVAIMASGGLSHTVIEEEMDNQIIEGLKSGDTSKLLEYPDERFRAGTSEIKNWIALAGAMSVVGSTMTLVDYVPCYRTEAGNGCAMGFGEWV